MLPQGLNRGAEPESTAQADLQICARRNRTRQYRKSDLRARCLVVRRDA
jgi:hypothetical protein